MQPRDAWPGQLGNVPVLAKMSTTQDDLYLAVTQNANKTYMAPVSPWCKSACHPTILLS